MAFFGFKIFHLPNFGIEITHFPPRPYMGSFAQTLHFFAAAQEYKDLQSPCRGPSSVLTNIFCVDP